MADLVVVVPSRGRPQAVAELAEAFEETCTADTAIVLAIDADDPERARYYRSLNGTTRVVSVIEQPSGTMVSALNMAAVYAAGLYGAVGFLGDDHRPRTKGWDQRYLEALRELGTGIVYGNDLLQGENLPTQCAMTSDIIRTLGHMAPPTLRHMYVDNYWRDLGRRAGCLRYLPDVVVEHMHPIAGKSAWTEGHQRVNTSAVYEADAQAYESYAGVRLADDAVAVGALFCPHCAATAGGSFSAVNAQTHANWHRARLGGAQ